MEGCVFCDIAEGKGEATRLFDDDLVVAFLDLHPVNEGHLLIIPKQHAVLTSELDDETVARMFTAAQGLNKALRESGLRCEGVGYFLADGEAAGQEIFHVHLHLIPRFVGDGFGFVYGEHYGTRPQRSELDAVGERIVRALRSG